MFLTLVAQLFLGHVLARERMNETIKSLAREFTNNNSFIILRSLFAFPKSVGAVWPLVLIIRGHVSWKLFNRSN